LIKYKSQKTKINEKQAKQFSQKQKVLVEFDKSPNLEMIRKIQGLRKIEPINATTFVAESDGSTDLRPALFHFAVHNQLILLSLKEQQQSLENVFQDLTK